MAYALSRLQKAGADTPTTIQEVGQQKPLVQSVAGPLRPNKNVKSLREFFPTLRSNLAAWQIMRGCGYVCEKELARLIFKSQENTTSNYYSYYRRFG